MSHRNLLALLLVTSALGADNLLAAGGGDAVGSGAYYEFEDPFVVNIRDGNRMRYMQVKVQVKTGGSEAKKAVEHHMPAIRHAMIMLLAHQSAASIRQPTEREQVRQKATEAIQSVLARNGGKETGIEAVYFTDFVIQ